MPREAYFPEKQRKLGVSPGWSPAVLDSDPEIIRAELEQDRRE